MRLKALFFDIDDTIFDYKKCSETALKKHAIVWVLYIQNNCLETIANLTMNYGQNKSRGN